MCRIAVFTISVLIVGIPFFAEGQIPERAMFQPGTYGFGPYVQPYAPSTVPYAVPYPSAAISDDTDEEDDPIMEESGDSQSEWEKTFAPVQLEPKAPVSLLPPSSVPHLSAAPPEQQPIYVPHLAFAYDKKTQRFHLTPYEGGYASSPAEFPRVLSPLSNYIASPYSDSQIFPQVRYMSYYDPDPVILPAAVKQKGLRFVQDVQPIPIPSPKPENARPAQPQRRTRNGAWRSNWRGEILVPQGQ